MKRCSRCKEEKPLEQFKLDKRRPDGHSSQCRQCVQGNQSAKYWKNPERIKRLEIKQSRKMRKVKQCSKCKVEKSYAEFHTEPKNRDGYDSQCRACQLIGYRVYYLKNQEKLQQLAIERARKYREENPEYGRQQYWKNLERNRERMRQWSAKNKEKKYKITKIWKVANRERVNVYMRNLYKEKPEMFLKRDVKRRIQKRNIDFESVNLKTILAQHGMICHLCGKHLKKNELTFDHLIPLNRGGPHAEWNLAPACRPCNSKKGDRFVTPAQPPLFA